MLVLPAGPVPKDDLGFVSHVNSGRGVYPGFLIYHWIMHCSFLNIYFFKIPEIYFSANFVYMFQ